MKLLKALPFILILSFSPIISGQNLIGYNEKEIKQYMKEKQKNMSYSASVNNSTFKYLKYTDIAETQTLLFFLTTDSVCKSVRLISDKNLIEQKIKELDAAYKKTGTNVWSDTKNGKKYTIELKEDDWTFNVTYRLN
jgi:hypothetical protein